MWMLNRDERMGRFDFIMKSIDKGHLKNRMYNKIKYEVYNGITYKRISDSFTKIHSLVLEVRVMVFNATFNNIPVISLPSVLLMEETRVPGENHQPVASH